MPQYLNNKDSKMRYVFLISLLLSSVAYADGYSSPYGEWRGQTEYQAFIRTASDPASHIVTNLTINVDPQGKVVGTSTENGCRMLGLASPGITPTIVTLKVTLTGCAYSGYNRSYSGSLSVFSKEGYSKFSLQALDVSSGKAGIQQHSNHAAMSISLALPHCSNPPLNPTDMMAVELAPCHPPIQADQPKTHVFTETQCPLAILFPKQTGQHFNSSP